MKIVTMTPMMKKRLETWRWTAQKKKEENKLRTAETSGVNQMKIEDLNEIDNLHVNKQCNEHEAVLNDDEDNDVAISWDDEGKEKQV